MSLSYASVYAGLGWAFTQTNTGFTNTVQGPDEVSANISYDVSTTTKQVAKQYTISASGTQTVDLQTITDWVSTALGSTKACAVVVKVSGNAVTFKAGASNGLTAFFLRNSGQIYLPAGSFFACGWPYSSAATVDSTHKTFDIVADSGTSATVTFTFLGA